MANYRAIASGNWSNLGIWQDNGSGSFVASTVLPTAADDVYANTFTVNIDQDITVNTLRNTSATSITAGGSFNFNTGGITINVGQIINVNNTTFINVNHSSGLITLNSSLEIGTQSSNGYNLQIISDGNITINAPNVGLVDGLSGNPKIITKPSGNGTLTINSSLFIGNTFNNTTAIFNFASGNVIINGNVEIRGTQTGTVDLITINGGTVLITGALLNNLSTTSRVITGNAGTLTVNGNITGNASASTVVGAGTFNFIMNGTVTTVGAIPISFNSTGTLTLNQNLTSSGVVLVSSTAACTVNVNGNVTASATAVAISLTHSSAQVFLNGNMYNVDGRQAIYASRIWLGRSTTTEARFWTSGGQDRTLYSEDTFPNLPLESEVRSGTLFGPDNMLEGEVIIPSTNDVVNGVLVDNTTGNGLFTVQELLDELKVSTDPMAQRIRRSMTPEILTKIIEWRENQ